MTSTTISAATFLKNTTPLTTLSNVGRAWLNALDHPGGFYEAVSNGAPLRDQPPTGVTQSRLGYCWSHLALLFPGEKEFARAAEKSFSLPPLDSGSRIYDHSFYLLFMSWYFSLTGDQSAIARLKERYTLLQTSFDNAGVGGFGPQPSGIRSHNPYMHLLEAQLTVFRHTSDSYWIDEATKTIKLFFNRLLDRPSGLVFEFFNDDWSVTPERRIEIGHQFEWATLLSEFHVATNRGPCSFATQLHDFALHHGLEAGLAIDTVTEAGKPVDKAKLLWVQTEAIRQGAVQWDLVRDRFFHPNGWSWYNRLAADGTPVEEPSYARLLYHVITAAT